MEMQKFFKGLDLSTLPVGEVTEETTREVEAAFVYYITESICGAIEKIVGVWFDKAKAEECLTKLTKLKNKSRILIGYKLLKTDEEFPVTQTELTFVLSPYGWDEIVVKGEYATREEAEAEASEKDTVLTVGIDNGKVVVAETADGTFVHMSEDTFSHMAAHPDVKFSHIREAILKIAIPQNKTFLMQNIDLNRTIGKDHCVSVISADDVRMEIRPNRQGKTPIVYNREAEDTSLINIGMCVDDDGLWTLFTAFYGVLAPKEPWDARLTEEEKTESVEFWNTHALVK